MPLAFLAATALACAPSWHYRRPLDDPHDADDFAQIDPSGRGGYIAVGVIRNDSDGMLDSAAFAEALESSGAYARAELVSVPSGTEPTVIGSTTRRCGANFSRARRGAVGALLVTLGLSAVAWTVGAIQTRGFQSAGTGDWVLGLAIGTGLATTIAGVEALLLATPTAASAFVDCEVSADLRVMRSGRFVWSRSYRDRVRLHPDEEDLHDARMSQVFLRIASRFGRDYGGAR